MSWTISTKQYIPVTIGEAFGGGYFAGYISHTANGNPTHALIVAPRATGASGSGYTLGTNYAVKTSSTSTPNTTSTFDGYANTQAMIAAGIDDHPAAKFCVNLTIGGYTDWYLPSIFELNIAYFNLKPTTSLNTTTNSANIYAVPRRNSNWTATYPTRTPITAFNTSAETFVASQSHWSSTEYLNIQSYRYVFSSGGLGNDNKSNTSYLTRAFRRISLSGYTT